MQVISNFKQANTYLSRFYSNIRADGGYTLDKMYRLMKEINNPQDNLKVIHVAGTSGKTSTAYYINEILLSTGKKTGMTISPHIDEINERIQINGNPINEKLFCKYLTEIINKIDLSKLQPSWFELMIALSYWIFDKENVDYAVVEVGLGGLNDGTNVIYRTDKVCVITDIGYDHMNILGNSLSLIAAQKAGIIKQGNAVFSYKQSPEIMHEIVTSAHKCNANLKVVDGYIENQTTLPDYQYRNWYLAFQTFSFIAERDNIMIPSSEVLKTSQSKRIPGRMEVRIRSGKTIMLDGAHNSQKMTAFINSFQKLYPGIKPALLLAMREGKDVKSVTSILSDFSSKIVTTTFDSSQDLPIKSISAEILAESFNENIPVEAIHDQSKALSSLLNSSDKIIVITGSLYLIGQLKNKNLI